MSRGREPVVRSGLYALGASIATKGLAFVRGIVVARLIAPNEFGKFVLAATALGVLDAFSQPGLTAAVVQRDSVSPAELRTVWTVMLVRGAGLSALGFVAAPLVADLVNAPEITGLLRVASFVFLLRGLASLSLQVHVRRMDLVPEVRVKTSAQFIETVVAVALAMATHSALAPIVAILAGTATEAFASYLVPGFRPGLRLARSELARFSGFSRWYFVTNVLEYVSTAGDDLVVGSRAGPASLANYRVAYRTANLPTTEVTHVIGKVAFPAYARTHEVTPARAHDAYRRNVLVVAGIAAPAAALLAAMASPLIITLLGDDWKPAITPLAIMCAAGFLRAIFATGGPLFAGVGRPQLGTAMLAARSAVLLVAIFPLLDRFGITGAAWASLLSVAAMLPPWWIGLHRLGHPVTRVASTAAARLPAAALAGVASWLTTRLGLDPGATLALGFGVGSFVWLLTAAFDRPLRAELTGLVRRIRGASAVDLDASDV